MTRYALTPIAEEDIREIAAWIAGHNPIAAERFVDAAYDAFEFVIHHPAIGHYRRDLTDQSAHCWPVKYR